MYSTSTLQYCIVLITVYEYEYSKAYCLDRPKAEGIHDMAEAADTDTHCAW